jgi:hypothetical protein
MWRSKGKAVANPEDDRGPHKAKRQDPFLLLLHRDPPSLRSTCWETPPRDELLFSLAPPSCRCRRFISNLSSTSANRTRRQSGTRRSTMGLEGTDTTRGPALARSPGASSLFAPLDQAAHQKQAVLPHASRGASDRRFADRLLTTESPSPLSILFIRPFLLSSLQCQSLVESYREENQEPKSRVVEAGQAH